MILYLNAVDSECESVGISHAHDTEEFKRTYGPKILCGASSGGLNWTGNPTRGQKLCKKCERIIQAMKNGNGGGM